MHFAGDLAGDALGDLRHGVGSTQDRVLGVAEHVDETGRDDLIARIDDTPCAQPGYRGTNVDDPIADGRHATTVPWVARAIDDARIGDEQIVWPRIASRSNRCAPGR